MSDIGQKADEVDLVQDLYINQLKAYKPAPQVCTPTHPLTVPRVHPSKSTIYLQAEST